MALCIRKNTLLRAAGTRPSVARSRVVSVNAFKVTLKTPTTEKTIECPDDMYILVRRVQSDQVAERAVCALFEI